METWLRDKGFCHQASFLSLIPGTYEENVHRLSFDIHMQGMPRPILIHVCKDTYTKKMNKQMCKHTYTK